MGIRHYSGEYLISPVGVHFGLNWCTHNCGYCFANLNNPNRRGDWKGAYNAIKAAASKDEYANIAVNLLRAGYDILCANDSDPFAKSNADAFGEVYKLARDYGFHFSFQTRGGENAIKTIEEHPPTLVYISVTSDDDKLIAQIEPGAPRYEDRWKLIRAAKAAGHQVVLGINPLVTDWWRDFDAFIDRMREAGVRHVWAGQLHLSRFQIDAMPAKTKDRMIEWVEYGKLRNKPDDLVIDDYLKRLIRSGVNVTEGDASTCLGFYDEYASFGRPIMPTIDSLFMELRSKNDGGPVAFSLTWFDKFANRLPRLKSSGFGDYLVSFARSIRNTKAKADAKSFRDVHKWYWRVDEFPTPLRIGNFSYLVDTDGEQLNGDHDGEPMFVWHIDAHDKEETKVSESMVILQEA